MSISFDPDTCEADRAVSLWSDYRADDIFEVYLSRIANAQTAGFEEKPDWLPDSRDVPFLDDVSAKRIDNDQFPAVEPSKRATV